MWYLPSEWESEQHVWFNSNGRFKVSPSCCPTQWISMRVSNENEWQAWEESGKANKSNSVQCTTVERVVCAPVICARCVYVVTWNHRENVPRIPGGFGVVARSLEPPEWCWECGLCTEELQNEGKVPPQPPTYSSPCSHTSTYISIGTQTHTFFSNLPMNAYVKIK